MLPFYSLSRDQITLPEREQFPAADRFYATALHEVCHSTGHSSRLNRPDLGAPFGSEAYAREELRAEIASLMIGDKLGIGHDPSQHAAYVGSWVEALQKDPYEIFRASRDADRITTYVMAMCEERKVVRAQSETRTENVARSASTESEREDRHAAMHL